MSFSLVGPWAFGGKLTSSQMNALDADHVNALDKTAAGDTLSGLVAISTGGTLSGNVASAFLATVADAFHATTTGAVRATAAGAIQGNVFHGITAGGIAGGISDGGTVGGISAGIAGGISDGGIAGGIAPTTARGISDGGIVGGIGPTVAGGISDGGVAGGIKGTVAGGIQGGVLGGIKPGVAAGITSDILHGIFITIAGGLATGTAGGFVLGGGSTDWPTFSANRTVVRSQRMHDPSNPMPTGWTQGGLELIAPATTVAARVPLDAIFNGSNNGATLTGVSFTIQVADPHLGGLPAIMPSVSIFRERIVGGSGPLFDNLNSSGGYSIPTPGSAAAWYDSNFAQTFSFVPDQNNVIDTTQYRYFALVVDEHGANAVAGNFYLVMRLTHTAVANMGF